MSSERVGRARAAASPGAPTDAAHDPSGYFRFSASFSCAALTVLSTSTSTAAPGSWPQGRQPADRLGYRRPACSPGPSIGAGAVLPSSGRKAEIKFCSPWSPRSITRGKSKASGSPPWAAFWIDGHRGMAGPAAARPCRRPPGGIVERAAQPPYSPWPVIRINSVWPPETTSTTPGTRWDGGGVFAGGGTPGAKRNFGPASHSE